ncbi:MAG: hypothetical protein AAB692_04985, partial [Patescibacteria group bacterium]
MALQHQNLADGKWFSMTLAEQMGNIGSEVGRTISWREKGNEDYAEKAFVRSLELIDLTLADDRWRGPKRREIARARESWCASASGNSEPDRALSRYFTAFAILARTQKG